jgi:hypothetical protein
MAYINLGLFLSSVVLFVAAAGFGYLYWFIKKCLNELVDDYNDLVEVHNNHTGFETYSKIDKM